MVYTNPLNVNAEPIEGSLTAFRDWYDKNGTDESIVKIVEYPYCPIELDNNGTKVILNTTEHAVSGNGLLILKPNVIWSREIRIDAGYPGLGTLTKEEVLHPINNYYGYETKLLNSAYGGYVAFAYDSASWICRPELLTNASTSAQKLTITMLSAPQSGGIAFKFDSNQNKITGDDFFIQSQRDNTLPTYNSEYIQYLKYGNAIEQKQLGQNVAQSVVSGASTALGAASTVLIATAKGAGSGGWIGAAVGAAVGVATAAINLTVSNARQADKIELTKRQGANSAARASTTNDLEIFDNLNLQALKLRSFKPLNGIQPIYDFFTRFGYATDEYGSFPTNDRKYWDYVQADVSWKSRFQWKDRLDDMTARFKDGVTIYHLNGGEYDLEQTHENWENSVIEWAQAE